MNPQLSSFPDGYRGRLAPSPTGFLHLGHARTFWTAQERARTAQGTLVLRNEDLDTARCKPEFVKAMVEDLRWFGFEWQEGAEQEGAFGPYDQSHRLNVYREAFRRLRVSHRIYPCYCSRKEILSALSAPHAGEEEPIYPGTCRPPLVATDYEALDLEHGTAGGEARLARKPCWRFRVPTGRDICFLDGRLGAQRFTAGRDFGDFIVWRQDGFPSYQLAVVVDDAMMRITEVVRGEDLLLSTARQLLLYEALEWIAPAFYHCPLLTDETGTRLAKRHETLSLRRLREQGHSPASLRAGW